MVGFKIREKAMLELIEKFIWSQLRMEKAGVLNSGLSQ